jgi:hypothetical protein
MRLATPRRQREMLVRGMEAEDSSSKRHAAQGLDEIHVVERYMG